MPSPQEHNVHPAYRPDIDGLRAMAILAVIVFHAFPTKLRGGFIGVDIFFVISGFLISSIIFRSLQRGDFSFTEFYAHRIKRIFPALILVLVASYIIGWSTMLPNEFKQLGKHMAAGAGFVQNFVLWQEVGYFDTASELKSLMHLWSLGIEEQFYIFYPLLIWGAWRMGLNILTVVVLLGLLSFGLNVRDVGNDAVKVFFLPHTRFWELLAGAVLVHLQLFRPTQRTEWLKHYLFHPRVFQHPPMAGKQEGILNNLLSLCGLLLIVAAVFGLHKGKLFPGWWAMAPVLGAFLLILAGSDAWVNRKILASRLMVFIGLISYPLYLWHWPLLSFVKIVESGMPSREIRVAAVALSFLLAWLTYRFLERPIRFGRKSWVKTATLCVLMAAVGFAGYNAFMRDGLPFRQIAKTKAAILNDLKWDGLWANASCVEKYKISPCQVSGITPDVIIIGDSHANHLYPGLASSSDHVFLAVGACRPWEGVTGHTLKNDAQNPCATTNAMDLEKEFFIISANKAIKTAILSAFWRPFLDGNFSQLTIEGWGGAKLVSKYPEEQMLSMPQLVLNGLKRTIKHLKSEGLRVVFVRGNFDIPQDLAAYCQLNKRLTPANCTIPKSAFVQQRFAEDKLVDALKDFEPSLTIIDPIDQFCDQANCFLMRDGVLYYRDQDHLSVSGSKLMAEAFHKNL